MKRLLKWLIPCLVACFMVVGLVQTASYTFANEEGQTEETIGDSNTDLGDENSNDNPVPNDENTTGDSGEEVPEGEDASDENLEESEIGPEETPSRARVMFLSGDDQVSNKFQPEHSKTVSKTDEDDDYLLSLSVTGKVQTETVAPPVDVVLVVDTSGSMSEGIEDEYIQIQYNNLKDWTFSDDNKTYAEVDGTKYEIHGYWLGSYRYYIVVNGEPIDIDRNSTYPLYRLKTKREALNEAVTDSENGLSNALLGNNENVRMAVVTFSTRANIKQFSGDSQWTDQASAVNNAMASNSEGGTNYQDALIKTKTVLKTAREDAQKYVIFLSDGQPTYRIENGKVAGNGSSDPNQLCENAAYTEASTIGGLTGFYTVGFGIDEGSTALTILEELATKPTCDKRGSFLASDTSSLIDAFKKIIENITTTDFTGIRIEDTLSDYVDLTEGMLDENGRFTGYSLAVTDADGNEVTDSGISGENLNVTYNPQNKKVSIIFPSDYVLKDGCTYTVSFNIEPNEDAYNEYVKTGKYPNTGDPYTGESSSGEYGFYSNKEAKLYYKVSTNGTSGEEQPAFYAKPVVQINLVDIPVTKNWIDADDNELGVDIDKVDVSLVTSIGNDKYKVASTEVEKSNSWSGTFNNVPMKPDGSYPKYSVTDKVNGFTVFKSNVEKDKEGNYSATITNKKNPTLTINKIVTGDFGNKNQTFKVDITLKTEENEPLSGTFGRITFDQNGVAEDVKISVDEPIVISNLPFGTSYKVVEDKNSAKGYNVTYEKEQGTLKGNVVVTITNDRSTAPITGIIDNTPKGLGLIGSIVVEIAAIAFVLKKKRQLKM